MKDKVEVIHTDKGAVAGPSVAKMKERRLFGIPLLYIAIGALLIIATAVYVILHNHQQQPAQISQSRMSSTNTMPAGETNAMVSLSSQSIVRANVSTAVIEWRDFLDQIATVGVIRIAEPNERTITARARGRIEKLYVSATGDYIRKGSPLYDLYSPDLLNAEQEFLISLRSDMKHATNMPAVMQQGHSNAGLIAAGRKRLELYGLTESQISLLEKSGTIANSITVLAPESGVVIGKLSQEGAYVDEGTALFQLADLSTVWAELSVPEASLRYVTIGEPVRIQTEAYPNTTFAGKVIFISPVEDERSKTITVRAALPNPQNKLRPSMTFTANIATNSGRALAVPLSAVVRTGAGDFVWVKTGEGTFASKKVTLGTLSPDNYYQVLDGVVKGEQIAATGAFMVDAEHQITEQNPMANLNMNGGDQGSKNSGEAMATVRAIDPSHQMITLDHGTVPGVMAAMTMAYKVSDPKFITQVKINQTVRFTLTKMENGEYDITAIQGQ